jgi:electron transport complex protein RnfG
MDLEQLRSKIGYHGASLAVIGLLASAALATADQMTRGPIHQAEAKDLQASLAQVLPEGFADNDLLQDTVQINQADGTPVTVYRARKAGKPQGAVFQVASRGYAADIVVLMGVDQQGKMLGVRVLKHQETPGLGDKIEIAKNPWVLSFNGKSLSDPKPEFWAVKKDGGVFDQFAGATITPRAVVKAVKGGMVFFSEHREEIFSKATEAKKES